MMVRVVMLLLVSLWVLSAAAEPLVDAYRAEAQVVNQSEEERIAAIQTTLGNVIVRITGDAAALQHPLVHEAISNATRYLLQFNYAPSSNSKNTSTVTLVLTFSPEAIEKLLHEAGLGRSSSQQELTIQVANVQNFAAFKQVQAYLKTVAMIRRSELISTHKDRLQFNLSLTGDALMLKNVFAAAGKLQVEDAVVADMHPTLLYFRWQ